MLINNPDPFFSVLAWLPKQPKLEILYHHKPLNAGLGIYVIYRCPLSFIARGSSEEIWVARASAEAMLRYSPRAIGQPQTKFMAIMCIILENTKKKTELEKDRAKSGFVFFISFSCFWCTRSAATTETKLHPFISLELKGSYSSNKIRITQNEHLNIICQNLNCSCKFEANFLFFCVHTNCFLI